MKALKKEERILLSKRDIIKYQLIKYCFLNKINLSGSEFECLTLLCLTGKMELSSFCNMTVTEDIFKTPQTCRNFLNRISKLNIVSKDSTGKMKIEVNPSLEILSQGNIVLIDKVYHIDTKES
jgi:hypothetical protein